MKDARLSPESGTAEVETSSSTGPRQSDVLPGARKFKAFLYSEAVLALVTFGLPLTGAEFIKGQGMILGLFVGANAVVHGARALGGKDDAP